MKKTFILLAAAMMAAVSFAQTVSSSTVEFKYCTTTEGSETKMVVNATFPYQWHGINWKTEGTQVVTIENARGCDSILTLTLQSYIPCAHKFAVSDGSYVYFSPGNLQYQASTGTWRFALDQWGYYGTGGGNETGKTGSTETPRKTQEEWIDLFNYGAGCSSSVPAYTVSSSATGNLYTDWGCNVIGTDAAHTWHNLSNTEWNYLVNKTGFCGTGNVNGVNGLIFLPDDWVLPQNCTWNSNKSAYDDNVYVNDATTNNWQIMEAAGAVFLPAAGQRKQGQFTVEGANEHGVYWSTDCLSSSQTSNIWCLDIQDGYISAYGNYNVKVGQSVRLVKYAE